jgi:hypothetical protein
VGAGSERSLLQVEWMILVMEEGVTPAAGGPHPGGEFRDEFTRRGSASMPGSMGQESLT